MDLVYTYMDVKVWFRVQFMPNPPNNIGAKVMLRSLLTQNFNIFKETCPECPKIFTWTLLYAGPICYMLVQSFIQ